MCQIVVINRGEVEITSPNEFKKHFGFYPIMDADTDMEIEGNLCLCNADLEDTFKQKKIPYKMVDGDYYIGQLDQIKE